MLWQLHGVLCRVPSQMARRLTAHCRRDCALWTAKSLALSSPCKCQDLQDEVRPRGDVCLRTRLVYS